MGAHTMCTALCAAQILTRYVKHFLGAPTHTKHVTHAYGSVTFGKPTGVTSSSGKA